MNHWVLCVEVNGEWESCGFATRQEAVSTFVALAKDYSRGLKTAVLTASREPARTHVSQCCAPVYKKYVN